MVLVGVLGDLDSNYDFMDYFQLERQCIIDPEQLVYDSYDRGAAEGTVVVPLHVVIDRDGIVRYYEQESSLLDLQNAIQQALDRP